MVITLVGAGNLATSLGVALQKSGHEVKQLWSRTEATAKALADRLGCEWTTDNNSIYTEADVIIISVKDDAIADIASHIETDALVLHTAGSVPLSALPQSKAGVLYPLQTFSRDRIVDFANIPLFIETRRMEDMSALRVLAESMSHTVYELTSRQRCFLHLSAVFACNFVNHCYDLASQSVEEAGVPFSVLFPLIDETARKVHSMPARNAQTGPALRWDTLVMAHHLKMLQGDDRDIYELMSNSIYHRSKQHHD